MVLFSGLAYAIAEIPLLFVEIAYGAGKQNLVGVIMLVTTSSMD
jgi:hypothetical protein